MSRGPSAIYRAVHARGWRVEDLRIPDAVMEKAKRGEENYRTNICIEFRRRLTKDTGHDPGWVDYEDLLLTHQRDVPPQPITLKPRLAISPSSGDDVGEGGCGCECAGCDQGRHCGKPDRGCKFKY